MQKIVYRKITPGDKERIDSLIADRWGGNFIVVHDTIYYPSALEGFIALNGTDSAGLITYKIESSLCEIVTLDSFIENKGVGSELISLALKDAKTKKCNTLWLITTNDNIHAIEFYQKRGFQLTEVFPYAVNEARKLKPSIPKVAQNKIPIRDELKFSYIIK